MLRQTDGYYITRNMYLASFLQSQKYNVDPRKADDWSTDNRRFVFWVKVDEKLEELVDQFYNRNANVEVQEFCLAIKNIKNKMYA